MKIIRTHLFKSDFQNLPDNIKRSAEKALRMLLNAARKELTITDRRTKPLRGRKKDWYVAPFFLLNLVQFGVVVPPLLSFSIL